MGQKKTREKTAEDLQTERVTAALEETDRTGRAPASVRENPGQFLRDMYDVWHRQGGKEGGRWRNSIRKMRDEWLVGRSAVPSLHPKLMGRVKVTRSDARALIDLFLERWRYGERDDALSSMTRDGYVGFSTKDQRNVRGHLISALFSTRKGSPDRSVQLPTQKPAPRKHGDDLRVQSFIEDEVQRCDALITFSRNRIAIGLNPAQTMKNFFLFFNECFNEDELQNSSRIFIWIVDLGPRVLEEDTSFYNFYNAGFLSLLLQAFLSFESKEDDKENHGEWFHRFRIVESSQREKRWRWLLERSVIVVDNLRLEEFQKLYGAEEEKRKNLRLKDTEIKSQHVLPIEIPSEWLSKLKKLAGKNVNIKNLSFTSLIRKCGWESLNQSRNMVKYYAHARTISDLGKGNANILVESAELPSPGKNYDDALQMVYLASLYRLRGNGNFDTEEATAFAYLRHLGYHVLKIDDFIRAFHPWSSNENTLEKTNLT